MREKFMDGRQKTLFAAGLFFTIPMILTYPSPTHLFFEAAEIVCFIALLGTFRRRYLIAGTLTVIFSYLLLYLYTPPALSISGIDLGYLIIPAATLVGVILSLALKVGGDG